MRRISEPDSFGGEVCMVKTLSLEELYEQQIKPRPLSERLHLLAMIEQALAAETKEEGKPKRSIMELHGLGAELSVTSLNGKNSPREPPICAPASLTDMPT